MIVVAPKLLIQNESCKLYNEKFALLLLLKESSPTVLSSSSMWLHSINKDRETHGEYVIIFNGKFRHNYWNMSS